MKIGLIILNILLMEPAFSDKPLNEKISIRVNEMPLNELCELVQQKSNIKIYYHESWVKNIKVSLNADSLSVETILITAVKGRNLEVRPWENHYLLIPKNKILNKLPRYEDLNNKETFSNIVDENQNKYITGRQANAKKIIQIGKKNLNVNNALVKIRGNIIVEDSKEPAIGATIFIEETKTGSSSDLNGNILISLMPGKYNAVLECLGLEKERCFLIVYSDGQFNIEMKRSTTELNEVVVFGDRQTNITSKDPGLEKIAVKTIQKIPMMMGERDLLKASEMLPGIVSVGEGSAGLNVRGGNSDQNAFYINKIPIYNTSHMFGFFPIFNSDIIKDFSIYKGHIPAQYGGRLSSVFDIQTRPGSISRYTFHGGINPISANLTLEGPIIDDKLSFLINGRSTYSDWILSRIDDPTISNSSASFNDFSASVNYQSKVSQMVIFLYNSTDKFRLSDINSYEYTNTGFSLNFRHSFNDELHGDFALITSRYGHETVDKQELLKAYNHDYQIDHYEAKLDFNHTTSEKNSLEYGFNATIYNLNRGSILPYGTESLRNTVNLGKEQGFEGALYFSDMYDILPWLSATMGLRYSLFAPLGPKKVNTYSPDSPRDLNYVNDTLSYKSGEIIKYYSSPDFRFAANIETDKNGSVKLSFNQMQQSLFMLNNTITVAPNTQWKLSDYHITPSKSNQFSAGVFRNIPKGNWETSVEFFYKTTTNYSEFKDGADFINTEFIETEILQGTQKSYGIEFLLKRSNKKLDGWLSYTYSRSSVKVDGNESWEKINDGELYPSNYDIPHVINTVINYNINRRVTLSSVINYQTGRPVTYPISVYYVNGAQYIDYSKRNEYRIPDYFRIDMSLTIEGNLKKNKLIHSSWMLSLYNMTGRKNAYSVYFKTEEGRINSYKYSVIGIPFFTFTWLFKFGNYDSE